MLTGKVSANQLSERGLIERIITVIKSLFSDDVQRKPFPANCNFSNVTWNVKEGGPRGPGPNHWAGSKESVWCDDEGRLHLRIREINGTWHSAEIFTSDSPGHGTYRFKLSTAVETLDENVVAGLSTYQPGPNEIDIEFSRWSDPNYTTVGSYTVWNGEIGTPPEHSVFNTVFDPNLSTRHSTHEFTWTPQRVDFRSWEGHSDSPDQETLIQEASYTGENVPETGDERLRINLWLNQGWAPTDGEPEELIVESVGFTPYDE